ncbi:hypothetical protein [Thalassovita mangrovi]|nr:hypothetical protein [Thalassovita mangrovi]
MDKAMDVKFDELPWHDTELLSVNIDRKNPGKCDEVSLKIRWPNGERSTLVFTDCYGFEADMNFGIVAEESILDASVSDEDDRLSQIRSDWRKGGVDLSNLKLFEIEMNSSGSLLKIFSLGFNAKN